MVNFKTLQIFIYFLFELLTLFNILTLLIYLSVLIEKNMKKKNQAIQEERMKSYFVEATKTILKGEGLKAVNVRNIAKEAGYSYATLYNYFKDVKELVFECAKDFESECTEIVKAETKKSERGIAKIKSISKSYIKYFVQYPGIFELFFLERITDLGHKNPTINLVYFLLDNLCEDEWNYCIEQKIWSKKDVEIKKELLRNGLAGSLLFYLNRHMPQNYNEFVEITNRQIEEIVS